MTVLRPWILGKIVNCLVDGEQQQLFRMVACFFSISILIRIFLLIANKIYLYLETYAVYAFNMKIIKRLYKVSYTNICREDPVVINQKINSDCNIIINFCISFFRDFISNIFNLILIGIIIIYQLPILGIVLFILVGLYIIVYILSKRKIYKTSLQVKEKQTEFFAGLYHMISGMKSIRNNGFSEYVMNKQNSFFKNYFKTLNDRQNVLNMYDVANGSISLAAQIFLFLYGGIQVIKGKLSIGFLTTVITYFSNLIQSTNFFLNLGEKFQDTSTSYNRILPYLKMKETKYGKTRINQIEDIRFENVVFKYPDEEELFCFNEKFEMGNIYWLEGRNGIGKTTLANLFMGLFGLDYKGRILIDDKDIKELAYRDIINKRVAIVEQNPYLLLDSVKNNIICKAEGEIDEQVLDELIDSFGLKDVALRDSRNLIDYQNINLSDGEKQKIVILRMLFSNASVWILDEPTSSLDKESKNVLYEELRRRKKDHIIILITHEKPQIYDRIISMRAYADD